MPTVYPLEGRAQESAGTHLEKVHFGGKEMDENRGTGYEERERLEGNIHTARHAVRRELDIHKPIKLLIIYLF